MMNAPTPEAKGHALPDDLECPSQLSCIRQLFPSMIKPSLIVMMIS